MARSEAGIQNGSETAVVEDKGYVSCVMRSSYNC